MKQLPSLFAGIVAMYLLVSCTERNEGDLTNRPPVVCTNGLVVSAPCSVMATGEVKGLYDGDDADWMAGRSMRSSERFKDNADGTLTDRLTGLMWMYVLPDPAKSGYGRMLRSEEAEAGFLYLVSPQFAESSVESSQVPIGRDVHHFLSAINGGNLQQYNNGFSNWRWPTLPELTSLFVFANRKTLEGAPQDFPAEFMGKKFVEYGFGFFSACTRLSADTSKHWNVAFLGVDKKIEPRDGAECSMLPVRSLSDEERKSLAQPPIQIPAVGPRGKDPEADKQWPNPRFQITDSGTPKDNNDDVVADRLTGLFWTRKANPSGKNTGWYDAVNYCNSLKLGGYDDWRMPNIFEMLSLVCYGVASPVIANTTGDGQWKESDPFIGVQSALHWTSTAEYVGGSDGSYVVDIGKGGIKVEYVGPPLEGVLGRFISRFPKHPVWPVRGGETHRKAAGTQSSPSK